MSYVKQVQDTFTSERQAPESSSHGNVLQLLPGYSLRKIARLACTASLSSDFGYLAMGTVESPRTPLLLPIMMHILW